jgi:hypothetical protein
LRAYTNARISAGVRRSSTSTARKWEALVTQADPTWRRDLRMVREFYDIRPDVVADWTTRGPYMGGVGCRCRQQLALLAATPPPPAPMVTACPVMAARVNSFQLVAPSPPPPAFYQMPGVRRLDRLPRSAKSSSTGPLRKYGCPFRRPQLFWLLHPQPPDCSKKHVWQIFLASFDGAQRTLMA